jgi:hypothetical protein
MRALGLVAVFFTLATNAAGQEPPAKGEPASPSPRASSGGAASAAGATSAASPRRFTAAPVLDVERATTRAVSRLLELQRTEGDGEQWPYRGVYREDENVSPLGYRVGGTAIVCLALVAVPGYADDVARQEAVERGVRFLLGAFELPRMQEDFVGNYDVRGWGHVYALECLLTLHERDAVPPKLAAAVAAKTKWLVATLVASAIPESGGWNYSRPGGYRSPRNRASTFMTAPALQALFHAQAQGHEVPDAVVTAALDALERSRGKPGGYAYGAPAASQADVDESKLSMMDKTPSSAARAPVVETTLLLAGRGDAQRLAHAIDRFFAHWDDLAVRKSQQGTHVAPYGIAPYYFMFGHMYCAQAIEQLGDAGAREQLRRKLRAALAKSCEDDGTWNDRQFERSAGYGTAFALLALHAKDLPAPARWRAAAAASDGAKDR